MTSTPDDAPVDAVPVEDDLIDAAAAVDAVAADAAVGAVEAEPLEPDAALLEAHDLALAALREITPEATIGAPVGHVVESGGVVSLRFANRLAGYPGWFWTVSVARVEGSEPTVLEVELLPGDGALLAPDWVPWAERLAEYQAAQVALAEAAEALGDAADGDDESDGDEFDDDADEVDTDDDFDDELDDVEDLDAVDFDADGSSILHSGDVDGVDIDVLDDSGDSDDDDSDNDEFDDEDDDSDD